MPNQYRTWNFHCGECKSGIVTVKERYNTRSRMTTTEVKKCNHCKEQYGLRGVGKLKQITDEQPAGA